MKLGQVIICSNLVYLPLFGLKIPFLSIFSLTYLYLQLFTYIWLYLGLITIIWAYFPLIINCPDFTIWQLFMEILHFKELGDTKVWSRMQFRC